jgi:hypothetical protein
MKGLKKQFYLVETVSAVGPELFLVNKDYRNYP